MKKVFATFFSILIFFLTVLPSMFLLIEDNYGVCLEINIEEESKEKKTKTIEFDFNEDLASNNFLFINSLYSLNKYYDLNYNSHYSELHSPPPEPII